MKKKQPKIKIKKSILHYIEYLFTRLILSLLSLFPLKTRNKIGIKIAFLLGAILKKKVDLIRQNLAHAFPEKTKKEIEEISHQNLVNFGRFLSEFIEVLKFNNKDLSKLITVLPDEKKVFNMLKDGGIVILGHMGNWEWHGSMVAQWFPNHVYPIVRRQSNAWNDRLIAKMRRKGGAISVYTDEGFFRFKKLIRDKKLLCILSDQDAGKSGIFVNFMNRQASTYTGAAVLARLTKCPVYFGTSWHEGEKLYTYLEELPLPPEKLRKNADEWERIFTENWVRSLELFIKEHPADYFWVHNRWKSKPVDK
jgi:KDO2-lipid IV(A) lauroyltransferase